MTVGKKIIVFFFLISIQCFLLLQNSFNQIPYTDIHTP